MVERLGGRKEIPVDVRIICATHQNLDELIRQERVREDLYYRVSEITIDIPPLKDREWVAVVLAKAFLERFGRALKRPVKGFGQDALNAMQDKRTSVRLKFVCPGRSP